MQGIMVASIYYMLVVVTMCIVSVANLGLVDMFFNWVLGRGGLLGIKVASINYMLVVVTMCTISVANFMVGEVFFF